MNIISYISAVKRKLRDQYGFTPIAGTRNDPVFADGAIPDGDYPMKIDEQMDYVQIRDGRIHCMNSDPDRVPPYN